MKTRIIVIVCILSLLLSMLLGGCGAPQTTQTQSNDAAAAAPGEEASGKNGRMEGAGFASGEDVLLYALSAIRSCDLEALVSCYAIETFLERFSFEDYYAWNPYDLHNDREFWPVDGGFGTEMNRRAWEAKVLCDAAMPFIGAANGWFAEGLVSDNNNYTNIINGEVDLDAYLAALKRGEAQRVFATLRVTGGVFNATEAALDERRETHGQEAYERLLRILESDRKAFSADQWVEYGIPVNVDGLDCVFCVTAVNYGEKWYLQRLGSSFEDFQSRIGGFSLTCTGADAAAGTPAPVLPEVSSAGTLAARRHDGPGFSSPEEAAKTYAAAFFALDPDGATACYAADRFADGDLMLRYTKHWRLSNSPLGGGTFLAPAARITLAQYFTASLGRNYLRILDVAIYDEQGKHWYETIDGWNLKNGDRIVTDRTEQYPLARAQLYDILNKHIVRSYLSNLSIKGTETIRTEAMRERAEALGASDYAAVVLSLSESGVLVLCVEAACFDGRWYVMPANMYRPDTANEWTLYS